MKGRNIANARRHVDYLLSVREELIRAENAVDKIKKSAEWKQCQNYFNVLHHRGAIPELPCKRNGYSIPEIISGGKESFAVVEVSKLRKCLTAKQFKEIFGEEKTE